MTRIAIYRHTATHYLDSTTVNHYTTAPRENDVVVGHGSDGSAIGIQSSWSDSELVGYLVAPGSCKLSVDENSFASVDINGTCYAPREARDLAIERVIPGLRWEDAK